jgi:hypothetical protein
VLIRKANELVQDNAAFVDSLGWLFFKQGKFAEALPELLRSGTNGRGRAERPS